MPKLDWHRWVGRIAAFLCWMSFYMWFIGNGLCEELVQNQWRVINWVIWLGHGQEFTGTCVIPQNKTTKWFALGNTCIMRILFLTYSIDHGNGCQLFLCRSENWAEIGQILSSTMLRAGTEQELNTEPIPNIRPNSGRVLARYLPNVV